MFNREHDEPGVTVPHSLTNRKPTKRIGMRDDEGKTVWIQPQRRDFKCKTNADFDPERLESI